MLRSWVGLPVPAKSFKTLQRRKTPKPWRESEEANWRWIRSFLCALGVRIFIYGPYFPSSSPFPFSLSLVILMSCDLRHGPQASGLCLVLPTPV